MVLVLMPLPDLLSIMIASMSTTWKLTNRVRVTCFATCDDKN